MLSVQPGSGADRAGLRGVRVARDGSITAGDIIVAVGGQRVTTVAELLGRLDDLEIGERVTLTLIRDGARVELPVILQAGGN